MALLCPRPGLCPSAVAPWISGNDVRSASLCFSALPGPDTHHTCYNFVPDNPLHTSGSAMNISGGFDSALLPSQLKVFQILNVELYPTKIFVLVPKTRYDFFSKLNVTVNPENHLQSKQAI